MSDITELGEQILAISRQSWADKSARGAKLTETEFIALDYLSHEGTAAVGQIRGHIGVLPAQMSRIMRSLEDAKFVTAGINRQDKRKIDVTITEAGQRACEKFRRAKLGRIIDALEKLTEDERSQFLALLHRMTS